MHQISSLGPYLLKIFWASMPPDPPRWSCPMGAQCQASATLNWGLASKEFLENTVCLGKLLCWVGFFHIDIIMSETEQFLPLFFVDQKLKLPSKTWEIVKFNVWINKTDGLPNQIQSNLFYTDTNGTEPRQCPIYRGVHIQEVGNVWFLAFLGPKKLSVIGRCP